MNKSPLVSVIVPVYNVEPYIEDCVKSMMAQTVADWECLCVDDGSTDGSRRILDSASAADMRFRVFHQKNKGVSAARNLALSHATGRYVVFLDGDDVVCRNWLESLIGIAEQERVDFIRFRSERFCETVNLCDSATPKVERIYDSRRAIVNDGAVKELCMGNVLVFFLRKLLGDIRFDPELRGMEDSYFCSLVMLRSRKMAEVGSCGYGYRIRPGSAVTNETDKKSIVHVLRFFKALEAFPERASSLGCVMRGEDARMWLTRPIYIWTLAAVGGYRMVGLWNREYDLLAEELRRLRRLSCFRVTGTPVAAWLPLILFMKLHWRIPLLFVWKVKAGLHKVAILLRRK